MSSLVQFFFFCLHFTAMTTVLPKWRMLMLTEVQKGSVQWTSDKDINCVNYLSLGWYLNLVILSKVKYLVYCEMCECTYNVIKRKNRVRTRTFGIRFCLLLYRLGVRICSGSCTYFTFGFCSVLGKTRVPVWFVLTEFEYFPISNVNRS